MTLANGMAGRINGRVGRARAAGPRRAFLKLSDSLPWAGGSGRRSVCMALVLLKNRVANNRYIYKTPVRKVFGLRKRQNWIDLCMMYDEAQE